MLAAKERASFPRHVSSRRGLAEIRWGEKREGPVLWPSPFFASPRRLSCAADGRKPYLDRDAREPPNAPVCSLPRERARGDDSLPTLGQAWLRE